MIISKITGGLGNQLFQYAAAKALALHHGVDLKLDISHFDEKGLRNFELSNFNIPVQIAQPAEFEPLIEKSILGKLKQRLFIPYYNRKPFKEPHFHFYQNFSKAPKDCYLKGNWQSEKYFVNIKDTIRQEFQISSEQVQHLNQKAETISTENSVAVHIRRGDYLNKETLQYHGILSSEYYNAAISYLSSVQSSLKLYFFSDDIDWVKSNIKPNTEHEFISGVATNNHLEDFFLMHQCKHNIIANSSFSWWCAWLNSHDKKVVIAPRHWFNKAGHNTKDLIPETWVTI